MAGAPGVDPPRQGGTGGPADGRACAGYRLHRRSEIDGYHGFGVTGAGFREQYHGHETASFHGADCGTGRGAFRGRGRAVGGGAESDGAEGAGESGHGFGVAFVPGAGGLDPGGDGRGPADARASSCLPSSPIAPVVLQPSPASPSTSSSPPGPRSRSTAARPSTCIGSTIPGTNTPSEPSVTFCFSSSASQSQCSRPQPPAKLRTTHCGTGSPPAGGLAWGFSPTNHKS